VSGPWRIITVGAVLAAMLGVLGLRLWAVQVTGAPEYQARAEHNQIRLVNTPAPRGDIFDRNGVLLAGTRPSLAVVVDMALVTDDTIELLATNLAAFLDEPASELMETFDNANSGAELILATELSEERALLLMEHREDFPGVAVIPQPVREYPGGDLAAHVLGYIGRPSASDLERPDVRGNDVVGKAGVERYYDEILRGTEGIVKYRVDADRTVLAKAGEKAPRPGNSLHLTIDAAAQAQLQASLREGLELARQSEMEQRVTALAAVDAGTRVVQARQEAVADLAEAAARLAEIEEEEEGTAAAAAALEELEALPDPGSLRDGDVLKALYDGLPLDHNGVCVPVQRVTLDAGGRASLSGAVQRSIRLVTVTEGRASERAAVLIVAGERFAVKEGERFATNLRAVSVEPDRVVITHSDKWCPVRAVGVVEDPTDGSIIAMGSYPSFDPTAFVAGLTSEEWERLGTANAFTNFAVQGLYAPASTFKVVAYMLALEEGIYPLDRPIEGRVLGNQRQSEEDAAFGEEQPDIEALLPLLSDTDLYNCTGSLRFEFNDGSSQVYRDWKRSGHGPLDLHGALQASCDLYFWEIALRVWNERSDDGGINNENLWQEWARAFGFGTASGVDLPFEKQGLIPDRSWFREEQRAGTGRVRSSGPWVGGDLMNAVVGQGTVLVTPLQLANGFATMVNGGTLWQPRVVDRTTDAEGNLVEEPDPVVLATVDLSPSSVTAIRRDLQLVVNGPRGTAVRAFESFGEGVELIGGKTGTAEIIKAEASIDQVDTGWFVGIAPIYNPRFVVSIVVERGGSGGRVAAPIARQVLQHLLVGPEGVTPLVEGAEAD
jgi:cell division protein FtsI/penicillin-binding protein 2